MGNLTVQFQTFGSYTVIPVNDNDRLTKILSTAILSVRL